MSVRLQLAGYVTHAAVTLVTFDKQWQSNGRRIERQSSPIEVESYLKLSHILPQLSLPISEIYCKLSVVCLRAVYRL